MKQIVLQKYIVDSGYCSRRQATEKIRQGKVWVNGIKAELGQKVTVNDEISISGEIIQAETKKVYLIINKPAGYVCTNRKFKGEKNVFDLLLDKKGGETKPRQRMFVVGRLDKNSHGLVLLTNDGELTQKITHPKYEHEKLYEVKVKADKLDAKAIEKKLKTGIYIGEGDGMAKARSVNYLDNNKFEIILAQGKKRQIRRMFEELGHKSIDIKRTRIGSEQYGIELGDLKSGDWRCLKEEEIKNLKR